LEIRILKLEAKGYPVEMTLNSDRQFERGYLDSSLLPWVPTASPQADGERLFRRLFKDDCLKSAWAEVRGNHFQRRIRLRIDTGAPELHTVPWELLRDPGEADLPPVDLAAAVATPFSRYLAGRWHPGSPILQRPIKILVAIANPKDLQDWGFEPIVAGKEFKRLKKATSGLEIELKRFPSVSSEFSIPSRDGEIVTIGSSTKPCTLVALENELKKGYHILHFIGHGTVNQKDGTSALLMANFDNITRRVSENVFAEMLARLLSDTDTRSDQKLRLVFLSSCHTATRSSLDAFRGLAPLMVAAGVPAVLAMQGLVTVETAHGFAGIFYERLLQHGLVDLAANEARSALISGGFSGSEIPVLFMRLRDGLLTGHPGQILGDRSGSFWNTLLKNIADGECTPFLGPGVTAGMLPSPEELALHLGQEYGYPFSDPNRLPRVAQFISTKDNRRLRKDVVRSLTQGLNRRMGNRDKNIDNRRGLCETIQSTDWSARSRELFENELHHQLADLKLPLYITTSFDSFMATALGAKGRPARREVINWRKKISTKNGSPHKDIDPDASPDNPVVLHLFGDETDLLSMVLTEDDHLDYLAQISRDYEYLLPTGVQDRLASTTLLFLGYRLEDLDLKVIMRGLLTNLDLERWDMLHVAVQIESTGFGQAAQEEVVSYFQKYFSNSRIDVYWGSARQFMAELHSRWQEHGYD
jgi:hypothetical protein